MPRISPARASASSAVSASLMPPAFPRPPVSTCAFTTTGKPSSSAAARAPAGSRARRPSDTGIRIAGRAPSPGTRGCPRRARVYRSTHGGRPRRCASISADLAAPRSSCCSRSGRRSPASCWPRMRSACAATIRTSRRVWPPARSRTPAGRVDVRAEQGGVHGRQARGHRDGLEARVGIDNRTEVGWELAPGATPEGSFGLQLLRPATRTNSTSAISAARCRPSAPRRTTPRSSRGSSSPERRGKGQCLREGLSWPEAMRA